MKRWLASLKIIGLSLFLNCVMFAQQPVQIVDYLANPFTSNSSTYSGKHSLDVNLLGTLGTAFSTPGAVDIKASNLHVNVDTSPQVGTIGASPPSVAAVGGLNVGGVIQGQTGVNPTGVVYAASEDISSIGGVVPYLDPCQFNTPSVAVINLTASGQLITGTAAKQTYICWLQFSISATADNVALVEGTGSTCGTSTAGMAGGATTGTGWNLLASGSVTSGTGGLWVFKTATLADNVCLLASSAAQISGIVKYVKQ